MLVAISIPIFTTQLEKAREATDLANIRSAYAEVSADLLTWNGDNNTLANMKKEVAPTQAQDNWQTQNDATAYDNVGGQNVNAHKKGGNNWVIEAKNENGTLKVTIN